MYRNLYIIGVGCLICLGIFFLSFTGSARAPADYIWNNGTEPQTLDPTLMSGQPEGELCLGLFEGLTAYHPETLEPVPAVAASWEAKGLTYTFYLRPDAWWVQGDEIFEVDGRKRNVVARDFVYTWMRHLVPETGSEYSYILYPIDGAEEYQEVVGEHWKKLVERYRAAGRDTPAAPRDLAAEDREELERFRETQFEKLVRVRAHDDLTLEITLKSPAPYFLFLTSFYPTYPVPREPIEEHGDKWVRPENIVSNGPYVLEEWKFNSHVRLRKNRHYWENADYAAGRIRWLEARQQRPGLLDHELRDLELLREYGPFVENGLEILEALAVEELNTSLNLYVNGDVDRIREIPAEVRGDLIAESRRPDSPFAHLHHGTASIVYYYNFNMKLSIFGHTELGRKMRRALALCVDRRSIVDVVTRGHQDPAYRLVPPGAPGYPATALFGSSGDLAQDIAEARRLVAEVRAEGVEIPRLKILYNTQENHAKIAAFIQAGWKEHLGIDVELANQEWGVYLTSKRTSQFDIARAGWIGDYPDPNTFLDLFTTENQNNDPKYSNALYDRIILKYCARILDTLQTPASRAELLADLRTWPHYGTRVVERRLADGRSLDGALRTSLADYEDLPENERLRRASEIRLLLLQVAEEMLMHDMPIIPIYFYTMTLLWPPELRGMFFNRRDSHPLKTLRWAGDDRRPGGSRYDDFPRIPTRPGRLARQEE